MNDIKIYEDQYNKVTQMIMNEFGSVDENVVISPASIIILLGIAAHATTNNTREEILNVIAPDKSIEEVMKIISKLQKILREGNGLISSNAVCVKSKFEEFIRADYEEKLNTIFQGKLFTSNDIVSDVNDWVKEHTKGMIEKIVDQSASNMIIGILNAVVFEAEWKEKYEEYEVYDGEFTNADGTVSKVQMLESTESRFVENDFFKGFLKPYKGEKYSFMGLLPKRKKSKSFLRRGIKDLNFSNLVESSRNVKTYVSTPEFKCDFGENLTTLCRNLGIEEIFTEKADFSNMSSANLMADSILHKAHIEVDRNGTKAAAATPMCLAVGCAPLEEYEKVTLDRPFVYAIINNRTGLPVFVGITNQIRD